MCGSFENLHKPPLFLGKTLNDYLTDSQLKAIMPLCNAEKRKAYVPFLNLSMAYFQINTELRVSMYLAQLAHESTDLTRWVENLNYSARRLTQVWSNRFPTLAAAEPFANNPQALANKVYNGRMGNRTASNDGWTYRGRAPIQATGRDMYAVLTKAFEKFGVDFVRSPDLLLQVQWGFMASAYIFAVEKNCLPFADRRDLQGCTKRINGGYNGLADRLQNYRTALAVLPDEFRLKSYAEFDREIFADRQNEINAVRSDTQSRLTVTNQDLQFELDDESAVNPVENTHSQPTQNQQAEALSQIPASASPQTEGQAVEGSTTKTVKGEGETIEKSVDVKNEQKVTDTEGIKNPEPYNQIGFWATIKRDLAAVTGGNLTFQGLAEYAQQANSIPAWLIPIVGKIALVILIASICYLLFRVIHFLVDSWKKNQRVKLEAEINTAIDKKNMVWIDKNQG